VGSLRCELPRVAKKVFEHHLDELRRDRHESAGARRFLLGK
jgi:hypothetical protein